MASYFVTGLSNRRDRTGLTAVLVAVWVGSGEVVLVQRLVLLADSAGFAVRGMDGSRMSPTWLL